VTTGALWLVAWWALEQWWESGRRRWLLVLAVSVGWCFVTRPLTGLALLIPVGFIVLRRTVQRSLWKDLGPALALGALVVAVLPLANRQTTGRWLEMPWTAYATLYTPYDHLGFGFDSTPPPAPYSPELRRLAELRRPISERHTMAALPSIAYDRLHAILVGTLRGGSSSLIPFALIGLLFLDLHAGFALLSALFLLLVHLGYAHISEWTPYYLETLPVVAFLAALGLTRLGTARRPRWRLILAVGSWIFLGVWLIGTARSLRQARWHRLMLHQPYEAFQSRLQQIADRKAIVFVRKIPRHTLGQSLVFNQPDLDRAPVWIVHDLGPENAKLLALVPDRVPYLYVEERRRLVPLALADSLLGPQRKR
jgi:4-amino-4-deoxy-L-arabinose transferase-like glycosyltransferase